MPCYRLRAAQYRYNELMGERAVVGKAGVGYIFETMRRCKLYDFEKNIWTDFDGNPTSGLTKPHRYLVATAAEPVSEGTAAGGQA